MVTILRKLRKSILQTGAFQKYLAYAVGEIALVVIGILIALQINNWNEGKSERKIEQEHMKNLVVDLTGDLNTYDQFTKRNKEIYAFIYSIFVELKGDNRSNKVSELAYWSRMITMKWMIVHPIERTFEEMKSSGHLRLIKDAEVAKQISFYYNSLVEFEGYNEAGMLWAADYVGTLGKVFDAEILLKIMRTRELQEAKPSDLLTEDPIILNQLMNSLNYFNGALSLGEAVSGKRRKEAIELVELIQSRYPFNEE